MAVEVLTLFMNTEDYLIKAEITMSSAAWKEFFKHVNDNYRQPMASVIDPLKKAVYTLDSKVLKKSADKFKEDND
jgi:hypothetical protein